MSVVRGPAYLEQSPPENVQAFIEAALAPRARALPVISGWSNVYAVLESAVIRPVYEGAKAANLALTSAQPQIQATRCSAR